ncbi:MAG: helix-turn-helix transcriptional regulator [Clostridia bacterium]|nr:helix-turn-helix transcriptional regulator [Clostridia bacterium]
MELKDKIYNIRKTYRLSLKEFGKILNVSDVAVLKWEQGKSEPKASNLKALANNFNISIDELLETDPKLNKSLIINNINSFNNFNNSGDVRF